jgi:putative ABC transport system permease protein
MTQTLAINLRIALKALTQNKLQALLTLCGMSVGVAMVVIVAGLGQGAQSTIEAQLESAGPTEITVRAGNFVPAGVVTSGEQDSSGGEPGEGSQSAFDAEASGLRPRASRPGIMRHRTPAAPLADAELKLARTQLANVRAVAAGVEGNVRLDDEPAATPANGVGGANNANGPSGASGAAVASASGAGAGGASAAGTGGASGTSPSATPASAPTPARAPTAASSPTTALSVRIVRVHGIEAAWPDIRGWKMRAGRAIAESEYASAAPVALLTPGAAARLWPGAGVADAINRALRIGGRDVRVVGVLVPTASGSESDAAVVPSIYLPLALAQTFLHRTTFDTITLRTSSVGSTTAVATDLRHRLRTLHGLTADTLDDFRVESQSLSAMPGRGMDPRLARAVRANVAGFEQASYEEISKSLRQAGRTLTLLLAGAATVSLLVGGIGVMNIMLVSVAARTREIGLRMAMGARTADVLTQFLAEAVALASLGGVAGLVLGSAALTVARHGLRWSTAISPGMLLLALSVAALTGVAFGLGPARRAAALEPVVALRCE